MIGAFQKQGRSLAGVSVGNRFTRAAATALSIVVAGCTSAGTRPIEPVPYAEKNQDGQVTATARTNLCVQPGMVGPNNFVTCERRYKPGTNELDFVEVGSGMVSTQSEGGAAAGLAIGAASAAGGLMLGLGAVGVGNGSAGASASAGGSFVGQQFFQSVSTSVGTIKSGGGLVIAPSGLTPSP